MRCIATLLISAGALALGACSDAGGDETSHEASHDPEVEISSAPVQVEEAGSTAEAAVRSDPTAAVTSVVPESAKVPAPPADRTRVTEPAPRPQPTGQATTPVPDQEPSPTPSPTCAPEHRELGHC